MNRLTKIGRMYPMACNIRMASGDLGGSGHNEGGRSIRDAGISFGGGSIREATKPFKKQEAPREEEYFYNQQIQQLSQLKHGLQNKGSIQSDDIKRHLNPMTNPKSKSTDSSGTASK